jgi:hypothetical protein
MGSVRTSSPVQPAVKAEAVQMVLEAGRSAAAPRTDHAWPHALTNDQVTGLRAILGTRSPAGVSTGGLGHIRQGGVTATTTATRVDDRGHG